MLILPSAHRYFKAEKRRSATHWVDNKMEDLKKKRSWSWNPWTYSRNR